MHQLSPETNGYLLGLSDASNVVWTEAGMSFAMTSSAAKDLRDLNEGFIVSHHDDNFKPDQGQLTAIAKFLQGAMGDLEHRFTSSRHLELAETLLKRLYSDIPFDKLAVKIVAHDTGADATLCMFRDHAAATLSIGWAVD